MTDASPGRVTAPVGDHVAAGNHVAARAPLASGSGPSRETTLPGVPGLGGLLRSGAGEVVGRLARTATARLPRRAGDRDASVPALPDVVYRVADVGTGDPASVRRLAAYQRLVGEPGSDALPAGYLHALGFPVAAALMTRRDFPLPVLGMVHLANAATVLRPVRLGDVLEVRAWAQAMRPHRRGTQVDLVTEVSVRRDPSAGGTNQAAQALAYRGVSTYLARGVDLGARADAGAGAAGARDFVAPLPTARWTLDAGVGRAYAAVSGDRNPIHTSALGARALGFPRAIAHGMYTAARALAEAGHGSTYEWTVAFATPVLLPGTVDVAITPAPDAAWLRPVGRTGSGYAYAGWDGAGRLHFTGTVDPQR